MFYNIIDSIVSYFFKKNKYEDEFEYITIIIDK